jgi:hypothetical protein
MLLVVGVLGVYTYLSNRDAQQQKLLVQAATTLGDSPMQSLRHAVDAYNLNHNEQARSAVLAAASSPRSRVVAGPKPMMIGMILTPDARHVVAYGAHGSIRVIGDNGFEEHKAEAVGDLRGTVIRSVGEEAAVNPDASRVALGTDQGTVAVINTTTG